MGEKRGRVEEDGDERKEHSLMRIRANGGHDA